MSKHNPSIPDSILKRAQFFQTVHVWPLSDELNYEGWLGNFKGESEVKLASLMLDFFSYYPRKMINHMLINSIQNAGHKLLNEIPGWKHSDFNTRCIYSFVPGENQNVSDSGYLFTRLLREVLEIPEDRLVDYKALPHELDKLRLPTPVVFVDDFIGSGSQCYKAWNINTNPHNMKTLRQIANDYGHIFIYAPLVVNHTGYKVITDNCPALGLAPTHILGPEYNLFDPSCYCWNGNNDLYKSGVDLILSKSLDLGIPFTNGRCTYDAKGFGEQGLALKFEHGAPDATIPLFYWCHENWTPLFNKTYQR